MCTSDDDYWLRELEQRAEALRAALWDITSGKPSPRPATDPRSERDDPGEPSWQEVWDFVHELLIPQIDQALSVNEANGSQVEMFNWQVGPLAISIIITANPDGVVIDSTMPRFARKLHNHYTPQGYVVKTLNYEDDATMQQPTRVHITRATTR